MKLSAWKKSKKLIPIVYLYHLLRFLRKHKRRLHALQGMNSWWYWFEPSHNRIFLDCTHAAQLFIINTSYYRNFDKSTTDSGRNELHSDENSQDKPQKMQSSQLRKNSGITVLDSVDETEDEEDIKTKNLAKYLGMKDGVSASISGQVIQLYLETYCSLPFISATFWYCITLIYVVTFLTG